MNTHPSHWHMGGWTRTGRRSRCGGPGRGCAHGRESGCEAVCKGCRQHEMRASRGTAFLPPSVVPSALLRGPPQPQSSPFPGIFPPMQQLPPNARSSWHCLPRLACSGRQPSPPPAGKCADSSPRLPPPARRPRAAARCWSWTCPCSPSAASRARTALACPSGWSTPTSTDRPGLRPLNATCWPVRKGRASVRALRSRARAYTCAPTV